MADSHIEAFMALTMLSRSPVCSHCADGTPFTNERMLEHDAVLVEVWRDTGVSGPGYTEHPWRAGCVAVIEEARQTRYQRRLKQARQRRRAKRR